MVSVERREHMALDWVRADRYGRWVRGTCWDPALVEAMGARFPSNGPARKSGRHVEMCERLAAARPYRNHASQQAACRMGSSITALADHTVNCIQTPSSPVIPPRTSPPSPMTPSISRRHSDNARVRGLILRDPGVGARVMLKGGAWPVESARQVVGGRW